MSLQGNGVGSFVEIPEWTPPKEDFELSVTMFSPWKYVKAKRKWGPKYQRVRANKPVVIWEI